MLKQYKKKLKNLITKLVKEELSVVNFNFPNLEKNVIEVNNYKEIMKLFGWTNEPILDRPDIYDFEYEEDLNERRIRDAESLATVVINNNADIVLEIGTSTGMGTILLAENTKKGKVVTINIPPDEIFSGEGGIHTTIALQKDEIGRHYKERNYKNIEQIYVNTAKWNPSMDKIDVAFIDGSHDSEFVINDTKKVLSKMQSGSFILWHDFNLQMVKKYSWINDVCIGIEKLYAEGFISGKIYHIKDSWVGIYRVP